MKYSRASLHPIWADVSGDAPNATYTPAPDKAAQHQAHAAKNSVEAANAKPWKAANTKQQTHCAYCRLPFTKSRPPTFDHVVPRFHGGTLQDGHVLCCQACNSARAHADHASYLKRVQQEHKRAKRTNTPYRRPKFVQTTPDGSYTITTASKAERKKGNL